MTQAIAMTLPKIVRYPFRVKVQWQKADSMLKFVLGQEKTDMFPLSKSRKLSTVLHDMFKLAIGSQSNCFKLTPQTVNLTVYRV